VTSFTDIMGHSGRHFAPRRKVRTRRTRHNDNDGCGAMDVTTMGNEDLEIVGCRIPALAQQLATRRALRLADYPLARASEWAPLPAGAIPFAAGGDEGEDLAE
jgi:hypothetical protein